MVTFNTWRSLVDGSEYGGIPDTSMFSSPTDQWWAGTVDVAQGKHPSIWNNQLSNRDATDESSQPTYEKKDGLNAIKFPADYKGYTANNLGFNVDEPHSYAVVIYLPNSPSGERGYVCGQGTSNNGEESALRAPDDDDEWKWTSWGNSVSTGQNRRGDWATFGASVKNGEQRVFLNGDKDGTGSLSQSSVGTDFTIGWRYAKSLPIRQTLWLSEVVVSDAFESDQAHADFYTDRLG